MGNVTLTPEELEAMLSRAARAGASQALKEIGLDYDGASKDIQEVRTILDGWRATRSTVWKQMVKIMTAAILIYIANSVWLHLKVSLK